MKETAKQFDWRTYWANHTPFSVILKKSFEEFVTRCDEAIKPVLTDSQEIAFYNVIDHRCDKWEQTDAPAESICKNISDYTERFIAGHVMSERKEAELRRFTQSIIEIINPQNTERLWH